MEIHHTTTRIHPLIAGAAISVILVSLVGVAAITGVLPTSQGSSAPLAPLSSPSMLAGNDGFADNGANPANQRASRPSIQYPATLAPTQQSRASQPQQTAQYHEQPPLEQAPQICKSCGKVQSVRIVQHQAKPSGVGVVAGAVLGGVLGNQVGGGNGRSLATVAGAVGGGYAGNEIEKRTHTTTSYQVQVRMEDGRIRHFSYAAQPGWHAGDHVRVVKGRLTSHA